MASDNKRQYDEDDDSAGDGWLGRLGLLGWLRARSLPDSDQESTRKLRQTMDQDGLDYKFSAAIRRKDFDAAFRHQTEGGRMDIATSKRDLLEFVATFPDLSKLREFWEALPKHERPTPYTLDVHGELDPIFAAEDFDRLMTIHSFHGYPSNSIPNSHYSIINRYIQQREWESTEKAIKALRPCTRIAKRIAERLFSYVSQVQMPLLVPVAKALIDRGCTPEDFRVRDLFVMQQLVDYHRTQWVHQRPTEFDGAQRAILATIGYAAKAGLHLPLEMWQHVFGFMSRGDFVPLQ